MAISSGYNDDQPDWGDAPLDCEVGRYPLTLIRIKENIGTAFVIRNISNNNPRSYSKTLQKDYRKFSVRLNKYVLD